MQSRYYDPEIGRFINADALVSTGQGMLGNNMFAYCRNNPVRRVDISGREDVDCTDLDGNEFTEDEDYIGGGGNSTDATVGTNTGSGSSNSSTGTPGGGNSNPGTPGGGQSNGGSNGNGLGNTTGYGRAPDNGPPWSKYTQISSDGQNRIRSETTYDENGMPSQRIDYDGRDHGVGLPHIHIFSNGMTPNGLKRTNETIRRYWGDAEG